MKSFLVAVIMMSMMISSSYSFTVVQQRPSRYQSHQQRYMFSTDESSSGSTNVQASPLEVVGSTASSATTTTTTDEPIRTSTPVERPKMLAKNMNTGEIKEVQWVDPAMKAHTNPFQMDWWAYPIIGLPFILLLNDVLHFIPEEGPISYLLRF